MIRFFIGLLFCTLIGFVDGQAFAQEYKIEAIRYGTIPDFPVAVLAQGVDEHERMDIALVFWVIRNDDRVVLFDTGFHRSGWFDIFTIEDFIMPDDAIGLLDIKPEEITDIIISHAHWDHMGGIDRFPNAQLWIQREEYIHYTANAWQNGNNGGGADPGDLQELLRRNTLGQVSLIDGDDVEILPGIRVYTGARHTYASQYIKVEGQPVTVLASDNGYLYRNFTEKRAGATFTPEDRDANLAAQQRMLELAGQLENIIPGHDPEQFTRFPSEGRVARIR